MNAINPVAESKIEAPTPIIRYLVKDSRCFVICERDGEMRSFTIEKWMVNKLYDGEFVGTATSESAVQKMVEKQGWKLLSPGENELL